MLCLDEMATMSSDLGTMTALSTGGTWTGSLRRMFSSRRMSDVACRALTTLRAASAARCSCARLAASRFCASRAATSAARVVVAPVACSRDVEVLKAGRAVADGRTRRSTVDDDAGGRACDGTPAARWWYGPDMLGR